MRTIEVFSGPEASLLTPAVIAAVAIALQCGVLSVLVATKRLAFLGQGITHAVFGGVGLAAVIGLTGASALALIASFCLASAAGISWTSARRSVGADTAIAVFLVGSMALGALLISHRLQTAGPSPVMLGWESLLFGSIIAVGRGDALAAWIVAGVVLATLWLMRRPMLFWTFDESGAEAFGVPGARMRLALMLLLALAIVVSMRLAGVVLTTAILVLPGAAALRMTERLAPVFVLSVVIALTGVLGGLVMSFEAGLPAGACIVAALIALFSATWPISAIANRWRRRAAERVPDIAHERRRT